MGCTNSNVRKLSHHDLPVEERLIETSENLLVFSKRKLEDSFSIIDSITYPIKSTHFLELCDSFLIEETSHSGVFLKALLDTYEISAKQLKYISILLSDSNSPLKTSFILSPVKKDLIDNISEVFYLAVDIIPHCLPKIETTTLLFSDILKQELDRFIKELRKLSVEEIRETLNETQISSKEIRIKIFYEFKKREDDQKIESKLERFNRNVFCFDDGKADNDLPESSEKNLSNQFSQNKSDSATEEKMIVEVDAEKRKSEFNSNDDTLLELRNMLNKLPGGPLNDLSFFEKGAIDESMITPISAAELELKIKEFEQDEPVEEKKVSVVDLYVQKSKASPRNTEVEKTPKTGRLQNIAAKVRTVNAITKSNLFQRPETEKVLTLKSPKMNTLSSNKAIAVKNDNPVKTNTNQEVIINKVATEVKRRKGSVKREIKTPRSDRKQSSEEGKKEGSFEVRPKKSEIKKQNPASRIGIKKETKTVEDEDIETKEAPTTRISKIGMGNGKK